MNLAVIHTYQDIVVRNMYTIVSEIVNFIGSSAKCLHIYLDNDDQGTRLKKVSATRWSRHEETLVTFLTNIEVVITTLDMLCNDNDAQTSGKAQRQMFSITLPVF